MNTALIVGSAGQDGTLLVDYLRGLGYDVVGVDSRGTVVSQRTNLPDRVEIGSEKSVVQLLDALRPDELYYLAAFHHSSEDAQPPPHELLVKSHAVHVAGFWNFLTAARAVTGKCHVFYAASSHIFGEPDVDLCDESTPFRPISAYGVTKLQGLLSGRLYRRESGLFVSSGILFTHESVHRRPNFLAKRIITTALQIKNGIKNKLRVGNLETSADWGYAPDYVRAMHRMLHVDKADDFIVATGKLHTVKEFVETVFGLLDMDWREHVETDPGLLTRMGRPFAGNARKLTDAAGWRPEHDFKGMIKILVEQESFRMTHAPAKT